MENSNKKTKMVTLRKACDILGVGRTAFYKKYYKKLTHKKDDNNYRTLYFLDEVEELALEKNDGIEIIG